MKSRTLLHFLATLALAVLSLPSFVHADSVIFNGSITIANSHTAAAPIGLGIDVNFNDPGSCDLPLFDPAQGDLTGVTITVKTNAPTFNGSVIYGTIPAIQGLLCTLNHQLVYTLSNGAPGDVGPLSGATDVTVTLDQLLGGTVTLTTEPAQIDSTISFSTPGDLILFVGASGQVAVNALVNSHFKLPISVFPTTLVGLGDLEIDVSISYVFNPPLPTPTPTPTVTPTASPSATATPSGTPNPMPWANPANIAFDKKTGSILVTNHASLVPFDPNLFCVFSVYVNDKGSPLP